jgi:hypothetical protein
MPNICSLPPAVSQVRVADLTADLVSSLLMSRKQLQVAISLRAQKKYINRESGLMPRLLHRLGRIQLECRS